MLNIDSLHLKLGIHGGKTAQAKGGKAGMRLLDLYSCDESKCFSLKLLQACTIESIYSGSL